MKQCDPDLCVTPYRKRTNRLISFWDRWKLIDLHIKPWLYWRGNIKMFGLRDGLRSNLTLTSPFLNRIIHWKHRNTHLVIPYTTRSTLSVIDGGKSKEVL